MPSKLVYKFGPYILDPFNRALLRAGVPVTNIDAQTFEVLFVLVLHSNKFVSRERLLKDAWKGINVDKKALRYQIHVLRTEILIGDGEQAINIETKYKQGYKLCVEAKAMPHNAEAEITEADRKYLEGRFYWQKSTARSVREAIDCFSRAVELDPLHAEAYSGLADSWVLAGSFGHQSESALIAMPKAETAAKRALEIDEKLPEARAALAAVYALYWWDWTRASEHFSEAVENSPNPMVRAWYSLCLAAVGEHEHAQREIETAINRNPALPVLKALRGRVYYLARDFERAVAECQNAIALEKYLYLGHMFLGHALRQQGRLEDARHAFITACQLSDEHPVILAELGHINAVLGDRREAMQMLARLKSPIEGNYVSPHMLAIIYLGLDDEEQALSHLEETYAEKGAYLIFLTTDAVYDPLRNLPEFEDLVRRVGFVKGQ